jgi:FtsP/CotA-like multicopper oxidase with cupredoxin domain
MKLKFRSTLIATALGAGKTTTSLVAATADTSSTRNGQPEEIRSKDGLLEVTLTVDLFTTPDLNRTAPAYNGSPVGPTLRAKPGDKVRITFINNLAPSSPENLEAMVFAGTPFRVDDAEHINQTLLVNRLQYPTGNLWAIPLDDYWGKGFQNLHFHGLMVDPTIGTLACHIIYDSNCMFILFLIMAESDRAFTPCTHMFNSLNTFHIHR